MNNTFPKKFAVDNHLIQLGPSFFGPVREGNPYQLELLPGMNPMNSFHYFTSVGLYVLLDHDNPSAIVRTKPSELLEILRFSRTVATAANGYEFMTFDSDQYRLIERTLHELNTRQLVYKTFWDTPTGKKKRGGKLEYKRQWTEHHHTVLAYYGFEGVDGTIAPTEEKKRKKLGPTIISDQPVVLTYDQKEKAGRRIRYEAIIYQLHPILTKGLIGEGIGFTKIDIELFIRRKELQANPTAANLLFWIPRQVKTLIKTPLFPSPGADGLLKTLNTNPDQPGRAIKYLDNALKTFKSIGIVQDFEITGEDVTIRKTTGLTGSDNGDDLPDGKEGKA